jgi:hypothetical protein
LKEVDGSDKLAKYHNMRVRPIANLIRLVDREAPRSRLPPEQADRLVHILCCEVRPRLLHDFQDERSTHAAHGAHARFSDIVYRTMLDDLVAATATNVRTGPG